MATSVAAIVLAAGQGTRMKSRRPKVLHEFAGRPMIGHVLHSLASVRPARTVVVVAPGMDAVAKAVAPAETAVQKIARGTADAVAAARPVLGDFAGDVLLLFGDVPLIKPATLKALLRARRAKADPAVVVLGFRPADTAAYGRMIVEQGELLRIVEHRDASPAERAVGLCNAGAMAIDGSVLWPLIAGIGNKNAKHEFYLTDIVAAARASGRICTVVEGAADDAMGVNGRAELAVAEAVFQARARRAALDSGVTLVAPETVFFSHDTKIAADVVIEPNVVFGPGVRIAAGARIRAFSHLEGAVVGPGAIVGPYARLRPGAVLEEDVHVGNFVEVKATRIGRGAKANHLTYLGDASVGAGSNIGAGTITCNYDGFGKYRTEIGAGAFVGSNSSLVAPVKIGRGAYIGSGSVITENVAPDALAIGRGRQSTKKGWAKAFRASRPAKKKD